MLAPEITQPRVVDGLDRICRGLGGVSRVWRFDRMATVCLPESGKLTASFAGVAKHYGVSLAIWPPRSGNRKGGVEKSNHTAAQRWWRTLSDDVTVEQAQDSLDRFCLRRGDTRLRPTVDGRVSVASTIQMKLRSAATGLSTAAESHRLYLHTPPQVSIPWLQVRAQLQKLSWSLWTIVVVVVAQTSSSVSMVVEIS